MGEELKPFETAEADIKTISHTRILVLMGFISIALSIYGFIAVSRSFGLGIVLGGILSFVNYFWLKHSLKVAFEQAQNDELPTFAGSKYVLRYFMFGIGLLLLYLTKAIPVTAVILGLASFAFAIVFEGIIRLFTSFKK